MASVNLSTEDAECYAGVCGAAGDRGRAAGSGQGLDRGTACEEQAVGCLLEKNEVLIAMGTYMGQCVQALLLQAVQRKMDHELSATGSTATCSVYKNNKVDKPVQTVLTAEDCGTAVNIKEEEEWRFEEDELKPETVQDLRVQR
jgi:hypothetical protein